jgi:hypothetical protein
VEIQMTMTKAMHESGTLSQRANKLYAEKIRPLLHAEDDGKYVAIDVATGDYEINADDYTAVSRLRSRHPSPEVWLERAGHTTACTI